MRLTLKDKKGDVLEIGEKQDMFMEQLEALKHIFNEDRAEVENVAETTQVLHKDPKSAKQAKK